MLIKTLGDTDALDKITLKTQALRDELSALEEQALSKQAGLHEGDTAFKAEMERLRGAIREQNLSLGDPVLDYVLMTYSFCESERFSGVFDAKVRTLKDLLNRLSAAENFWHHNRTYPQGGGRHPADTYEILSLDKPSHSVAPTEIRLLGKSSLVISIETVFGYEDVKWPFVTSHSDKIELVVAPKNSRCSYETEQLTEQHLDIDCLENELRNNALALFLFRQNFGRETDIEGANQYIHQVAFKAFKAIEESFSEVKKNDEKIMKIEEKYLAPQKETGMFAIGPVIPDPEPQPLLAAMLSSGPRDERNWALERLAACIRDLDRTGLTRYDKPLQEKVGVGRMKVSNHAEYAHYVRGILELGYKTREVAAKKS